MAPTVTAEELARSHYFGRRRLSDAVAELARRAWSRLNPANLDSSWQAAAPELLVGLVGAQLAAAKAANSYTAEILDEDTPAAVNPSAFAGRASDGRPLDSLLLNPVTVVKAAVASGVSIAEAMAGGYANLDMLVRTQLADAGRAADQVALVAHPAAGGYTRVLVGKSCSRCLVLAGRWYAWNAGFRRHPRCDCSHQPGRGPADGFQADPRRAFNEMNRAEQDKTFTINGAQAIRDGADISKVVNARRGMATAGETRTRTRTDGLVVNERIRRQATTRVAGRNVFTTTEAAGRKPRLMPEEIYRIAGSDRAEAVRLLRSNGYLTNAPRLTRPRPQPAPQPKAPVPAVVPDFTTRATRAATGAQALAAAPKGLYRPRNGLDRAQRDALAEYQDGYLVSFRGINGALRKPSTATAAAQVAIDGIDSAMKVSVLTQDTVTYRGVRNASVMFGDRLAGDMTGLRWLENAFVSTSADPAATAPFAGQKEAVRMRILTPKGIRAIDLIQPEDAVEAELLLDRGHEFRVVVDHGLVDGVRQLDVEVLPK